MELGLFSMLSNFHLSRNCFFHGPSPSIPFSAFLCHSAARSIFADPKSLPLDGRWKKWPQLVRRGQRSGPSFERAWARSMNVWGGLMPKDLLSWGIRFLGLISSFQPFWCTLRLYGVRTARSGRISPPGMREDGKISYVLLGIRQSTNHRRRMEGWWNWNNCTCM